MFQACHADVMDDLKTTLGNCTNLATRTEQMTCLYEAKVERREKAEYCSDQMNARNYL
jgi:hypothetical protein